MCHSMSSFYFALADYFSFLSDAHLFLLPSHHSMCCFLNVIVTYFTILHCQIRLKKFGTGQQDMHERSHRWFHLHT